MKQITETNFPYPVLLEDGGDYKNSHFKVDVNFKVENKKMLLNASLELKCPFIDNLIKKQKAVIFLNIEQKLLRKAILLDKVISKPYSSDKDVCIDLDSLASGYNIEIMPMIIAKEDIDFEYDESMNNAFSLFEDSFICKKGSILGYGNLNSFELPNENKISSIFTLSKMLATEITPGIPYKVDFGGNVIDIKVIPTIFDIFVNKKGSEPTYSNLLNSVFVYPVIQLAIINMFKDFDSCKDNKWCIALANKISSAKSESIENLISSELVIEDIIEYTNIILGSLLEDSFTILKGDED